MKNILVTGGAGFIGTNLVTKLLAEGCKVTVLDNLSPQIHGEEPEKSVLYRSIAGKVEFIRGDVTDRDDLRRALAGQDAVVHLAAETGTGQSMYRIDHYMKVNVGGTSLLLDILANEPHSVKRLVVASSRSIYGEGKYVSKELGAVYPEHRSAEDMSKGDFEVKYPGCSRLALTATDEESKLHPSSVYGITKQVQEQLVMTVCPTIKVAPVALRYQNVYGPGQSLSNPYTGILSIFSNLIMSGKPINVFEDGTESRDFVFIDDVARVTAAAVMDERASGHVFNVGTGVPIDVMTVATVLNRKLNGNSPITVTGNFRIGDIRHNFASLERIERALGFKPRVNFDEGLDRFCAWVQTIGAVTSDYEGSLAEMKSKGLMK
jgi:dTDP-L-rhamnose 4-epimerase